MFRERSSEEHDNRQEISADANDGNEEDVWKGDSNENMENITHGTQFKICIVRCFIHFSSDGY